MIKVTVHNTDEKAVNVLTRSNYTGRDSGVTELAPGHKVDVSITDSDHLVVMPAERTASTAETGNVGLPVEIEPGNGAAGEEGEHEGGFKNF